MKLVTTHDVEIQVTDFMDGTKKRMTILETKTGASIRIEFEGFEAWSIGSALMDVDTFERGFRPAADEPA